MCELPIKLKLAVSGEFKESTRSRILRRIRRRTEQALDERLQFERLGNPKTLYSDARIIAATNRDLEDEVRQGRFREDLWYRLKVFTVTLPPLRQRKADIP